MLVFALLATLIPSVTTGWISYLQNERSLSAKITGELQGVSAQTAREVDLWIKERLYELRVFASSYEVSENLDRIQRPGGERARERLTGYLRSVRERFADYQELLVVNPEGQEVASTAPQPTSVSLPQGWAKTIRQENAVVGDALWDDALKKGAVVFAVPIYQTGGRFLGALTAKLDFSALHRLLRRFAGGGEQSGQVYLITAGGRPIVGSRSDPTELMRRSLPAAVVRRMLDQEGTTREYRGLEGEEVVGTMKAVPRLDWAVLAEVPASEAFRQVTRLRNVTVLIVAALLVAVGLFAYFLGLLITRPLDRLTRAAAQVASGDLDVHLPVVGGGELKYVTEVFVVLMPETRAAGAIETAQRIRSRLATDELVGGKLSVSIGVSQFPDDGDAPEALLARADAALYRAKREGRDRVLRAPPTA